MKTQLKLIKCNQELLQQVLAGNDQLGAFLGITIPDNWTVFGRAVFEYALQKIQNDPSDNIWWTYLPVLTAENVLAGSCGYKGPPDEDGMVEIGYEVAEDYRNRDIATEIVRILVGQAFEHPEVKFVRALTLGTPNASTRVLEKNGFVKTGEFTDPEDGEVWMWEVRRSFADKRDTEGE